MILASRGELEIALQYRVLEELSKFEMMDIRNSDVISNMHSAMLLVLSDMQDDYPTFSAAATFIVDNDKANDPKIDIEWWNNMLDLQLTQVRFSPLRIERSTEDHLKAYERAMSIL